MGHSRGRCRQHPADGAGCGGESGNAQPWFAPRDLVVRAASTPTDLVGAITQQIRDVDATLPVSNITTFTDLLDQEVGTRRVNLAVLIAFAIFAVLLAVLEIYGLTSYFVVQHTSEIGVRLALGAGAATCWRSSRVVDSRSR